MTNPTPPTNPWYFEYRRARALQALANKFKNQEWK